MIIVILLVFVPILGCITVEEPIIIQIVDKNIICQTHIPYIDIAPEGDRYGCVYLATEKYQIITNNATYDTDKGIYNNLEKGKTYTVVIDELNTITHIQT